MMDHLKILFWNTPFSSTDAASICQYKYLLLNKNLFKLLTKLTKSDGRMYVISKKKMQCQNFIKKGNNHLSFI